jgi:hypothetical protein
VISKWDRGAALARCGRGALWAVPFGGGPAARLTDGTSKENPFGYELAWRYSKGRLGLAENGCGPSSLVRFNRTGHGHRVTVPSPTGHPGTPSYVAHHGNVVDMIFNPIGGCQGTRDQLFAYNAVSHTSRTLLGGRVNGGRVLAAMALGD